MTLKMLVAVLILKFKIKLHLVANVSISANGTSYAESIAMFVVREIWLSK